MAPKEPRDAEEIAEERVNGTGIRLTNGLKRGLTYGAIGLAGVIVIGALMASNPLGLGTILVDMGFKAATGSGLLGLSTLASSIPLIAGGLGFLSGVADESPVEKAVERETAMLNRKNMRSQMQQRQAAAEEMAVAQQYAAMQRQGQAMGLSPMNNNGIQPQALPPAPGGGMIRS